MAPRNPLREPRGYDTWLTVGKTNLKVHRALNLLLGELDLSLAQHEILLTIRRYPGLTQRELSEKLLVVKSNATALLKKLEARGLVDRATDAEDSRVKRLSLTRDGNALVERSFALQSKVVKAMVSVMSDDELGVIDDIMRRVGGAVDAVLREARA